MLPAAVAAICRTYLDAAPRGLVAGLHLHGGLVFGEWVPDCSDVDFVATLTHRPRPDEIEALRAAHAATAAAHPGLHLDGHYVLADDLTRDPDLVPPAPTILRGAFDPAGQPDLTVAWHELALGGVTVHGPPLPEVWTDHDRLLAFTRANLDSYWRGWAERLAAGAPEHVDDWTTSWCVLGVVRLHHLLATGEMTAKSRAGRWALTTYDARWHRVLREALRTREGGGDRYPSDPDLRGRDVADLTAHVVEVGTTS